MPTENRKKKSKKDEKKPLISIKIESAELKPLEHYVDDRIELIKQIFGSLKSKTIESIIPEFLQGKPVEEIQEICLEEVLGISKKRLLSIINATKCPSDTESSDSGSDVEKVEEHISLEEISSDSNDEMSKPKKKKKHDLKKDPKTEKKAASQNGQPAEKQYSVLELLELQARARAIRSQLALEPVTKIELDDSDSESTHKEKEKEKEKQKEKTHTVDPVPSVSHDNKRSAEQEVPIPPEDEPKVPSTRPLRLKRNFRQRQMDGYESDGIRSVTEKEPGDTNNVTDPTPEKPIENEKTPEAPIQPTAPNDDDVVPIFPEPEILCISSSDSEIEENKTKQEKSKMNRNYITMPVVEKKVRPPTEDEIFLQKIKEKSEAKKKAESNLTKESNSIEAKNDGTYEDVQNKSTEKEKKKEEDEMEDGEIIEDDDEVLEIPEEIEEPSDQNENESKKENVTNDGSANDSRNTSAQLVLDSSKSSSASVSNSDDSDEDGSSRSDSDNSEPKAKSHASKRSNADDDDDDIIDLGKDEDLDFEQLEMNTSHNEPKQEQPSTRRTRSSTKNIKSDRESSSELEQKDESWDKRWLRGDKVSKVLATAKLANKVRSKIKEKKTKTTVAQKVEVVAPPNEPIRNIPTNVEVGSVEHYKELTKQK